MKIRILLTVLFSALLLSCSSDDGDSGANTIVGTWDLVALELDGTTPEEEAAEQLVSLLALQGCYLITLESATYTYKNGQLSITDSTGMTETIGVILSGDRLTFDVEGSEFDDVGSSGSLIFERR